MILGLVISTAFNQIMATLRAYLSNYLVRNLDFSMMAQFFKHTMSLPYSFFAKRKNGVRRVGTREQLLSCEIYADVGCLCRKND